MRTAVDILEPIKEKHGAALTWVDLIVVAGTVSIGLINGPTFGFCAGRTETSNMYEFLHISVILKTYAEYELSLRRDLITDVHNDSGEICASSLEDCEVLLDALYLAKVLDPSEALMIITGISKGSSSLWGVGYVKSLVLALNERIIQFFYPRPARELFLHDDRECSSLSLKLKCTLSNETFRAEMLATTTNASLFSKSFERAWLKLTKFGFGPEQRCFNVSSADDFEITYVSFYFYTYSRQ